MSPGPRRFSAWFKRRLQLRDAGALVRGVNSLSRSESPIAERKATMGHQTVPFSQSSWLTDEEFFV